MGPRAIRLSSRQRATARRELLVGVAPVATAGRARAWVIERKDLLSALFYLTAVLLYGFRYRIGRGPLAGVLFFAVTLSPVLGFIDYGYMQFSFVADRYQYLAGSGMLAVVIGGAAQGTAQRSGVTRLGVQGIALVVLILMGTMTWRQADIYQIKRHFSATSPLSILGRGLST